MIQILPCPACSRSTELPNSVARTATIECPHCFQQYVVGELLEREFGIWKIVGGPAAPDSNGEDEQVAQEDLELELDSESAHAPEPILEIEPALELQPLPTDDAAPTTVSEVTAAPNFGRQSDVSIRPRTRRKSKSPLWSVIQIVLGGVAAVPIALLLIWHFIGTDVADLGPTVGRYVPWLVPEKFRPYEDEQARLSPRSARTPAPPAGNSGFRRFDDVMPATPEDNETRDTDAAFDNAASSSSEFPKDGNADTNNPTDDSDASETDAPGTGKPMNDALDLPKTDESNQPAAGDAGTLLSDSGDIFSQIRKTNLGIENWSSAVDQGSGDLKSIARIVYDDFIELASRLDEVPSSSPLTRTIRDQLKDTARIVADRADVQNVLMQGSQFWIAKNAHLPNYSLATIVDVTTARLENETWLVDIAQASAFEIRIPREVADSMESAERLMLLGTVRTDSSKPQSVFTVNYMGRL